MKVILVMFFFMPFLAFAQQLNYPLGNYFERIINEEINKSDSIIHTGFKPLLSSYVNKAGKVEQAVYQSGRDSALINRLPVKWFWRKLLSEDFIVFEEKNFRLYANPLLNLEYGTLKDSTGAYTKNTRGIELHGDIGHKLSFFTSFYENQAFFIDYIDEKVEERLVVMGQGAWKVFRDTGRDYAMATGYVSFTPFDFLNLQLGHGKHFIGEGYRSLLLSDNSFNYPYFKATFSSDKFQYIWMLTEFEDFNTRYYFYHYKKHGSFCWLSYSPHNIFQVALFEGIKWRTSDDSSYTKKFSINYFNPVILIRALQYGLNDENNIILGLNLKIKPTAFTQFYMQFVLDNIDFKNLKDRYFRNKYGYQFGARIFDVFHDKLNKQNFYIQAEYNLIQPYTYSYQIPRQNYSHYNQELAHPFGSGLKESVLILNYKFRDIFFEYRLNYAITSNDTTGSNFGSNIFLSDETATNGINPFENIIGQGNKATISHNNITLGYLFNPTTDLHLFASVDIRRFSDEFIENKSVFIYFGIKTTLNNYYYDF